ncbi:MAG TPA: hypothetical protein VKA34_21045 [Balneolales bacterium]|nr:hypothetical protein [Balneolales bacterium]
MDTTQMLNLVNIEGINSSEQTDYSSFKISNGYGMIAKAGAEATQGVEVDVDVKFKMESISTQDFKQWMQENKTHFDDEQWHKLEENYAAGGFLGGVLAGAFGLVFGAGSYNHYKNSHDKEVKNTSSKKDGFLKSLHDVTNTKTEIKGSIKVIGQSQIPSVGCIFVEVTSIQFKDGTKKTVVNTNNPVIADNNGDTSKFKQGGGKLNIVPIS